MIWAFLGLLGGILAGIVLYIPLPQVWASYMSIVLLIILERLLLILKTEIDKKVFHWGLFSTFSVGTLFLALILNFLGDKLGINIYLAITIVFVFRIFDHVRKIEQIIIFTNKKIRKKT